MLTEKILFQNSSLAFYYHPRPSLPPVWQKTRLFPVFFFSHPSLTFLESEKETLRNQAKKDLILEAILNPSRSNQGEPLLHALVNLPHKLCPVKENFEKLCLWKIFQMFKKLCPRFFKLSGTM